MYTSRINLFEYVTAVWRRALFAGPYLSPRSIVCLAETAHESPTKTDKPAPELMLETWAPEHDRIVIPTTRQAAPMSRVDLSDAATSSKQQRFAPVRAEVKIRLMVKGQAAGSSSNDVMQFAPTPPSAPPPTRREFSGRRRPRPQSHTERVRHSSKINPLGVVKIEEPELDGLSCCEKESSSPPPKKATKTTPTPMTARASPPPKKAAAATPKTPSPTPKKMTPPTPTTSPTPVTLQATMTNLAPKLARNVGLTRRRERNVRTAPPRLLHNAESSSSGDAITSPPPPTPRQPVRDVDARFIGGDSCSSMATHALDNIDEFGNKYKNNNSSSSVKNRSEYHVRIAFDNNANASSGYYRMNTRLEDISESHGGYPDDFSDESVRSASSGCSTTTHFALLPERNSPQPNDVAT